MPPYNKVATIGFRTPNIQKVTQNVDFYAADVLARLPAILGELEAIAKTVLIEEFEAAMAINSEYFDEYKEQVIEAVIRLPFSTVIEADFVELEADLGLLGTIDDLKSAYHYRAQERVSGEDFTPEGALKNPLVFREAFWEAIYAGEPYVGPVLRDGAIRNANIKTDGYFEETISARVNHWEDGGLAPEWLFLQFGQPRGVPIVRAYDILGNFKTRVYQYFIDLFGQAVQQHAPQGGVTIGQKVYKGGQFLPKGGGG